MKQLTHLKSVTKILNKSKFKILYLKHQEPKRVNRNRSQSNNKKE